LEKYDVAPTAYQLLESFLATANAFGNSGPVIAAYQTQQLLIQCMPPGSSPLLQLPHFNANIIRSAQGENARTHLSVQEFMHLPDHQRRKLTVGPGLLNESQYKQAIQVASQLPDIQVEAAFFKVAGERYVLPSSLVQFVIKARVIPPGSRNVPEVDPKDLEDVDPPEDDMNALQARRRKGRLASGSDADGESSEGRFQPPLSYSPYYARDHSPRWIFFLTDPKQGKIVVPGNSFSTFGKPIFDAEGKPTYNVQTIKMQFGAPPEAGQYAFVMHLICDSYVGTDTTQDVLLEVEEASKGEEIEDEEEISEPEEDSVAGQMSALRGQPTRRSKVAGADSSDDDSDTDDDEATDSDTDTDTETESDED
jgi:translocation protein SEC63